MGAEEAEQRGRDGEGGADGGDEVEGLRVGARPSLGDQPPVTVPPRPATRVMTPIRYAAEDCERPSTRWRKDGIHQEMPPSEKVTAA